MKWIRHSYKSHKTTVQFNFIHWFILGESSHKASAPTSPDSKAAQSVSQIQRQRGNKSEQFSASRIVKGLVSHTLPFSSYQASTVCFQRDQGLLLRDNLNGLWLSAKCASSDTEWRGVRVETRERRGGQPPPPPRRTTATFYNDDSKWKDGWLGFVEWYYLFWTIMKRETMAISHCPSEIQMKFRFRCE